MNKRLTGDWLVEIGGTLCISNKPNQLDYVVFADGDRRLEVYADEAFAVISVEVPIRKAAYVHLLKTREDFAQGCRLFRFTIDGLEVGC